MGVVSGVAYLHQEGWIHGDLKGVCAFVLLIHCLIHYITNRITCLSTKIEFRFL